MGGGEKGIHSYYYFLGVGSYRELGPGRGRDQGRSIAILKEWRVGLGRGDEGGREGKGRCIYVAGLYSQLAYGYLCIDWSSCDGFEQTRSRARRTKFDYGIAKQVSVARAQDQAQASKHAYAGSGRLANAGLAQARPNDNIRRLSSADTRLCILRDALSQYTWSPEIYGPPRVHKKGGV